MMRRFRILAGAVAVLGVVGCQDLDIVNTNNPDRDVALGNPADVETLISSSWRVYFNAIHNTTNINYLYPAISTEVVSPSNERALVTQSAVPRIPFNNSPFATTLTDPLGAGDSWREWHEVISSANEGLSQIAAGMKFISGTGATAVDNTARAEAFAHFTRGLAWGQLGLVFDRSTLIDETMPIPANPDELASLVIERLRPYPEVLDWVIREFDRAIEVAQANNITIPAEWMHTSEPLSADEFVRLANTYVARHMVYFARTPEERAAVNWQEVLSRTANGITEDFTPQLRSGSGGINSNLYQVAQRNVSSCVTCYRSSYWLIGPADVSGRYQEWSAKPYFDRTRFEIVTPDRRITGPEPTDRGAYFIHRPNSFGEHSGLGAYLTSAYQWYRADGQSTNRPVLLVSAAENDLLRAEALIRIGGAANLSQAAELINRSRTREVEIPGFEGPLENGAFPGLPPVMADGVPIAPDCVPKTETGACGNLLQALFYERSIEAAISDATRAYADYRGWPGRLPPGTWLHLPVPGAELDMLGLEVYTYGGVGGEWAAP